MGIEVSVTNRMVQVDTGDMSDLPPALPEGEWDFAVPNITCKATKPEKGSYPMVQLEMKVTQSYGDEKRDGARLDVYLVCFPPSHKGYRGMARRFTSLSEALGIDGPDTSSLNESPPTWDSMMPWLETVSQSQIHAWTTVKRNNENVRETELHFSEPGVRSSLTVEAAPENDVEPEPEVEAPKAKKNGNGLHKKNGKKH